MKEVARVRKEQLELDFEDKNLEEILEAVCTSQLGWGYYLFIIYHKTAPTPAEPNTINTVNTKL